MIFTLIWAPFLTSWPNDLCLDLRTILVYLIILTFIWAPYLTSYPYWSIFLSFGICFAAKINKKFYLNLQKCISAIRHYISTITPLWILLRKELSPESFEKAPYLKINRYGPNILLLLFKHPLQSSNDGKILICITKYYCNITEMYLVLFKTWVILSFKLKLRKNL